MKSIVIIEDDLAISQMYRMKFEADGFEVYLANNGKDGLELIRKFKPAIVLLDLLMAGIDGHKVLETIRSEAELADTPVMVLTNTESEQSELAAQKLGVVDYIIKANETPSQVTAKVKTILGM